MKLTINFGIISIHAPLAGCDRDYTLETYQTVISIHAPLAGCDMSSVENLFIS